MSKIIFLNNERNLDEIREFSDIVDKKTNINTIGYSNNNKILTSLIIGATLIPSIQSVQAKNIELIDTATKNYLTITTDYNKTISIPFTKYIDDINVVSNKSTTKHSIIKNILSFKSLNQSWDGFNAIPLEIDSATNAIQLIDLIGEKLFCEINDYYPNPNGTITLEWINKLNEKISVEVGNSSYSYFIDISSKEVLFFNDQNINSKDAKRLGEYIQIL
jgi:hypothetical protein